MVKVLKNKIEVVCQVCGKHKLVYDNPNQSFKYCSSRCYQKARGAVKGGMVEITCKHCGNKKLVPHKEVIRGQHQYCSKHCAAIELEQIPPQGHNHTCYYRGFNFRSKGEARFVELCDLLHLDWKYEPEHFKLSDSIYIPDFYLPKFDRWVEIKCRINDKQEKTEEFSTTHSLDILFAKDLDKLRRGLDYGWKN